LADAARTLYLLGRRTLESQFWVERWIGADALLTRLTDRFRSSPLTGSIEIEDDWLTARDVRVAVWPFAWLDLLVLVENHGAGRSLIRIGHRLQPAAASLVAALAIAAWPIARLQAATVAASSIAGVSSLIGVLFVGTALWRSTRTLSVARGVIAEVAQELGMQPLETRSPWRLARRRSRETPLTPAQCGDTE
jgi:hypothetical protein